MSAKATKHALYVLKRRQPGRPVKLTARVYHKPDYASGKVVDAPKVVTVRRPIKVPVKATRGFEYDLTYIASNKNFVGGGYFITGELALIIDVKDLKGIEINNNVIITNHRDEKFQVESYEYDEYDIYVYIHAKGALNK